MAAVIKLIHLIKGAHAPSLSHAHTDTVHLNFSCIRLYKGKNKQPKTILFCQVMLKIFLFNYWVYTNIFILISVVNENFLIILSNKSHRTYWKKRQNQIIYPDLKH